MKNIFTLSDVIEGKETLTESMIDSFICEIGYRCQVKTLRRLRSLVKYPRGIDNWGIYSRVQFNRETETCSYCAGQSYPDEIREVRRLLLKG